MGGWESSEGFGGDEGGEFMIRIYCVKKYFKKYFIGDILKLNIDFIIYWLIVYSLGFKIKC